MLRLQWKTLASCCLGIAALAGMLAFALNRGDEQGMLTEVAFSRPSGFYDDAFQLELTGDGNPIYYTLDSSDPDARSTPYTGPILIEDASPKENVYSAITETSVFYDKALLEQNGVKQYLKYRVPKKPVDKATVVRAVSVDASGHCSPVSTAVYFVGYGERSGYAGMNVMSIVTDPSNLFDDEKGIYVLGDRFKVSLKDGVVQYEGEAGVFSWPANYKQRGREWEREAVVHCFDAGGNAVFSGPCGIRIQGRATRYQMPKNLNIYARKQYGCEAFETGGLFGKAYRLNRLNLYNGANDLMLRDYMLHEMITDADVANPEYCPCVLFLDGEYWGVYWLCTRFKADYLNQEYGARRDNIISVKVGNIEIGEDEDLKLYEDMVAYIADSDMRSPEAYARAGELIDLQSCIDYYAFEVYIASTDWPTNNIALWRSRRKASDAFSDGRWRWMLFDLDHTSRVENAKVDTARRACNLDALFASLMQNDDFYRRFTEKLVQLAEETFAPERTDAFVDAYESDMAAAIEKKYQRFYGKYDMDKLFYAGCEQVREFFRLRQTYIINTYGGKDS
ncbi:MAG: CotH kinase family protein [Clostridia bacterium]|nr:CotH kinase family protein [Clostridia bacterium]